LHCEDEGHHPSDHVTIYWKYTIDEGIPIMGSHQGNDYTLYFGKDSVHKLEVWCVDAVKKESAHDIETLHVDTVGPTIIKNIGEPKVPCKEEGECEYYLKDHETPIDINAVDGGETCAVGVDYCVWEYWVDEDGYYGPFKKSVPFTITFPEESYHKLEIVCYDLLGNPSKKDTQYYRVDSTGPETWKWFEGPQYPEDNDNEGTHWITSQTLVHLEAEDKKEPCAVGLDKIYYKDVYLQNKEDWHYCYEDCNEWIPNDYEDKGWTEYIKPFTKEESCHIIEYYSVDLLGNRGPIKWQCVFVDNTPPIPEKEVREPKARWDGRDPLGEPSKFYPGIENYCLESSGPNDCPAGENCIDCWKVTKYTSISLKCIDQGDHPVNHEGVCFKVEVDAKDATERYCDYYCENDVEECMQEDGFCCVGHEIENFLFNEETEHELEYYCVDALGNSNKEDLDIEKFKVEGTPFNITLFKKWNLISVPFTLLDDDPEKVFESVKDDIYAVWTYDGETDKWYVYDPEQGGTLDHILPGWGYWVLAKKGTWEDPVILTIAGYLMSPLTIPPSRQLVKGWNLIGYYGTSWELYPVTDDYISQCQNFHEGWHWYNYIYGDKAYCALNSLVSQGYPEFDSLWSFINCGEENDIFDKNAWIGINPCIFDEIKQKFARMYAGRGYWLHLKKDMEYVPSTLCIWNDNWQCVWTGGGIVP